MHSTSFNSFDLNNSKGADVLVSVATLVTESRIPANASSNSKKFYEGPHCKLIKGHNEDHKCDLKESLCLKFDYDRKTVLNLSQKNIPLCIEVLLTCQCKGIDDVTDDLDNVYVLEQWHFGVRAKRGSDISSFKLHQLVNAIRSQLYFSQITAWLTTQDDKSTFKITEDNFKYHLTVSDKTLANTKFRLSADTHDFPTTDIGNGLMLNVSFLSLPRTSAVPNITCDGCTKDKMDNFLDDRMVTFCKLKGKHRCEDIEEEEENVIIENKLNNIKRLCQNKGCEASTSNSKPNRRLIIEKCFENDKVAPNHVVQEKFKNLKLMQSKNDLIKNKGQLLLEAIERSGQMSTKDSVRKDESDIICDKRVSDIFNLKSNNFNIHVDKHCDSPIMKTKQKKIIDISNLTVPPKRSHARKKITFDDFDSATTTNCDINCVEQSNETAEAIVTGQIVDVPSQVEQARFRKDLDNAASMVFHSRTGLPLTSSPAPVRRGKTCFDFDSSINSVSAIKSALFPSSFSTDDENESDGSIVSPHSPETYYDVQKKEAASSIKYRRRGHAASLLGSFEESVLNGRLEPVSTVHGFTAELGASGSFVPKHLVVPVTVFFYTLGDNDKVSSPYLSHINLGRKGYNVPKSGTVQVTLFNPLGTVVKMFVIMYDLSDMPPNSQTFIRQRTLYMPTNCKDTNIEWGPKWLRYLIHLRFMSSKSGKIYLHSDIRMIIFRKSDLDTATAHGIDMSYELRSFTHMPANPRFSPRK